LHTFYYQSLLILVYNNLLNMIEDFDSSDDEDFEEGLEGDVDINEVVSKSLAHTSDNISSLRNSDRYKSLLSRVNHALLIPVSGVFEDAGLLTETPEYKLILECNQLVQEIDEDISKSHKYVADIYTKKFPELEQLVPNKVDYLRTVERIGNETDMTLVDLDDILPSATVMVVSVTGSTTNGVTLSEANIGECMRGCTEVTLLLAGKALILKFVESRMCKIAPNLCSLIGSRITAQLMALVGGLINLSRTPSCNMQVVGQEKHKNVAGFSNVSAQLHTGILYHCDLVQSCPPYLRKKALKVISAKVALVARFDAYKSNLNDNTEGDRMHRELTEKIRKWVEPQKARTKKALPVPEEKKRSKRGGKRVRRFKERFQQTELGKERNKLNMSVTGGEYGDSAMGYEPLGGGGADSGKLRATIIDTKKSMGPPQKKRKGGGSASSYSGTNSVIRSLTSNSETAGMASSLAFTPVQGIELVNPNAQKERVKQANASWFDSSSGFLSAAPK
jgi:U4/U6 small nuclear ribonucleoprotein PRP31